MEAVVGGLVLAFEGIQDTSACGIICLEISRDSRCSHRVRVLWHLLCLPGSMCCRGRD